MFLPLLHRSWVLVSNLGFIPNFDSFSISSIINLGGDTMSESDRILFEDTGLKLSQFEEELIEAAKTGNTDDISKARVISTLYGDKLIKKALDEHAKALVTSAEASEKHERGLKLATWALFSATMALVIIGILPIFINK